MKIKTTVRYHLKLLKMAAIKKFTDAGEGMEKRELFYAVGGNAI